jgi:hypothetical protein
MLPPARILYIFNITILNVHFKSVHMKAIFILVTIFLVKLGMPAPEATPETIPPLPHTGQRDGGPGCQPGFSDAA